MATNLILLSTAYLPPVEYFSKLILGQDVCIEKHEHFIKQTYRNRCTVLGANGPIDLVVPIEKGRNQKTSIEDIRIFNQLDWQRNHWRTIFSAYNSSPFFEYYADDLNPFYQKKWKYLLDFNNALLEIINEIIEIVPVIKFTNEFKKSPIGKSDFRYAISPKVKPLNNFKPYTQVFNQKFGFVPNLSIIDLIFNEGPNSYSFLQIS
jgi:hypothetical protein